MCDARNQPTAQRADTIAPRAVNFEFPISRLSAALSFVAAKGLIEPVGLHLHSTAQWANDAEVQCCATAWTKATDQQWFEFCEIFKQDCVALASVEFLTAWAAGKNLELRASAEHGKTVGPTPWNFDPIYFIHPTQPRHIEA